MMLEERFVLFSVRSGGFVNQYSLFTDCPVSIHSFPRYFNYITPIWSAAIIITNSFWKMKGMKYTKEMYALDWNKM